MAQQESSWRPAMKANYARHVLGRRAAKRLVPPISGPSTLGRVAAAGAAFGGGQSAAPDYGRAVRGAARKALPPPADLRTPIGPPAVSPAPELPYIPPDLSDYGELLRQILPQTPRPLKSGSARAALLGMMEALHKAPPPKPRVAAERVAGVGAAWGQSPAQGGKTFGQGMDESGPQPPPYDFSPVRQSLRPRRPRRSSLRPHLPPW
jgi:hypothetical protein